MRSMRPAPTHDPVLLPSFHPRVYLRVCAFPSRPVSATSMRHFNFVPFHASHGLLKFFGAGHIHRDETGGKRLFLGIGGERMRPMYASSTRSGTSRSSFETL